MPSNSRETDWLVAPSYKQELEINAVDWTLDTPQFLLALTSWETMMVGNPMFPEMGDAMTVERVRGLITYYEFTVDAAPNRKAMSFRIRVGEADFGASGAPSAPASYTLAPDSVDAPNWANESFLWDYWSPMPFGAIPSGVVNPQIWTIPVDVKVRRRLEQPFQLQLAVQGSALAGDTFGRVHVYHSLRTLVSWK